MHDKTKRTLLASSLALALTLLTGCLVLNEAGLAPAGSMQGSEIARQLQSGGGVAYQFGVTNYCASRGDATACVNSIGPSTVAAGMILAGLTVAASVPFENDETYTAESVRSCQSAVRLETALITQLYLSRAAQGNDIGGVGAGDLIAAALAAAAHGASRCELEPAGKLFSVGELNL